MSSRALGYWLSWAATPSIRLRYSSREAAGTVAVERVNPVSTSSWQS